MNAYIRFGFGAASLSISPFFQLNAFIYLSFLRYSLRTQYYYSKTFGIIILGVNIMNQRRTGDTIDIDGNYQYKALTKGYKVQRFWHYSKTLAIEEFLPPKSTDKVIDVGCGSGIITRYLGEHAAEVLGVDGNPSAITWASENSKGKNISYHLGVVDESFGYQNYFDKIYCLEVIEHIYLSQAENMLRSFYNMLKLSGRVYLTTPNYSSYWVILEWILDRLHLVPELSGSQHVERYKRRKLHTLAQKSGFKVECIFSTSLLAPWLALISWRLADKIQRAENHARLGAGAILVCVLSKEC